MRCLGGDWGGEGKKVESVLGGGGIAGYLCDDVGEAHA